MSVQQVAASQIPTSQRIFLLRQAEAEIARNPKNVEALLTAAGIRGSQDDIEGAIALLLKAHALRKKDPVILQRLVGALKEAKAGKLARRYGRKLCEIEPGKAENHRLYAKLLEESGAPLAAIAAYAKADRLEPGNAATLTEIGRCHGMAGDHKSAIKCYRRALAVNPRFSLALYRLGTAHKFASEEEARPHVDNALAAAQRETDDLEKSMLYYTAGKAMDDTGQYDEAFSHFRTANELRACDRSDKVFVPFRNMTQCVTREFLAMRKDFGLAAETRPIFVLGMPRSGTTLTESLCGAHSGVTAGDELDLMSAICKSLGADSGDVDIFRRSVETLTRKDSREIAQDYLNRARLIAGDTPHFTDKLPHNFMYVGLIALFFPDAKIIHVRRHPLDNCLSLYSNSMRRLHNSYKSELTTLGLYYRQYLQLMEHWRTALPGKMYEVHYEDLVANTELNARAIIDHLGLKWEDGVLDRAGSQRSVKTLSGWQVRQPIYASSKGKWRHYEKHLGALMDALGAHVERYENELRALQERAVQAS